MTPSVGRIVHYVSYGTPGGEYDSECRAAVVTRVDPEVPERFIGVAVVNPAGLFFNAEVPHQEPVNGQAEGGTWHWPEHVE